MLCLTESFDGAIGICMWISLMRPTAVEDFSLDVKPGQRVAMSVQPEVEETDIDYY